MISSYSLKFVLMFLVSLATVQSATYYVDNVNGSDQNNGLSISTPWSSIALLNTKVFSPGDQILFKKGGTWKEQLTIISSGSLLNPVVFSAYGDGDIPVIDGENIRTYCIYMSGRKFVRIDNLRIINHAGSGGIRIKNSNNIVVDQCEFYVTGHGGLFVETSSQCVVSRSSFTTPSTSFDVQTDGIYSQRNNGNIYDGNNIIISNQFPTQHCDGIQSYLDTNIVVKNNYIEQRNNKTGNAQGFYATTGAGVFVVFNNVINCPFATSNTLGFRNLATGTGVLRVYNNTLINGGYNALSVSETSDLIVKNNIFVSKSSYAVIRIASVISNPSAINHNIFFTSGGDKTVYYDPAGGYQTFAQWKALGFDANSKNQNPMLNSSFIIDINSPAVDGGEVISPDFNFDIEGTPRPQMNGIDIGAYEIKGTPLPVELVSFTGSVKGKNIILNWVTANEINNFGFDIEKLKGDNWEKIGFVAGSGNSNKYIEYSYLDFKAAEGSKVSYRLKQIDIDGQFKYSDVIEIKIGKDSGFQLDQNYPNPFNPETTIKYSLPYTTNVDVSVFNMLGEKVGQLAAGVMETGTHEVKFNGSDLSSGIYFINIIAKGQNGEQDFSQVRKMNLLK